MHPEHNDSSAPPAAAAVTGTGTGTGIRPRGRRRYSRARLFALRRGAAPSAPTLPPQLSLRAATPAVDPGAVNRAAGLRAGAVRGGRMELQPQTPRLPAVPVLPVDPSADDGREDGGPGFLVTPVAVAASSGFIEQQQQQQQRQQNQHRHRLVPVDESWLRAHPLLDGPGDGDVSSSLEPQFLRGRQTAPSPPEPPPHSGALSVTPPPGFGPLAQASRGPIQAPVSSTSESAQNGTTHVPRNHQQLYRPSPTDHGIAGTALIDAAFAAKNKAGVPDAGGSASSDGILAANAASAAAAAAAAALVAAAAACTAANTAGGTLMKSDVEPTSATRNGSAAVSASTGLTAAQIQAAAKSRIAKGPGHQPPFECRRRYAESAVRKHMEIPAAMRAVALGSGSASTEEATADDPKASNTAPSSTECASEIDRLFLTSYSPQPKRIQLTSANAAAYGVTTKISSNFAQAALPGLAPLGAQPDIMKQLAATLAMDASGVNLAAIPASAVDARRLEGSLPALSGSNTGKGTGDLTRAVSTGRYCNSYSAMQDGSASLEGIDASGVTKATEDADTLAQWFSKLGADSGASRVLTGSNSATAEKDDELLDNVVTVHDEDRSVNSHRASSDVKLENSHVPKEPRVAKNDLLAVNADDGLAPNVLSFFTAIRAQATAARSKTGQSKTAPVAQQVASNEPSLQTDKAQSVTSKSTGSDGGMPLTSNLSLEPGLRVGENAPSTGRWGSAQTQETQSLRSSQSPHLLQHYSGEQPARQPTAAQPGSVERFFNMFKQDPSLASPPAMPPVPGPVSHLAMGRGTGVGPPPAQVHGHGFPLIPQAYVHPYPAVPVTGSVGTVFPVMHGVGYTSVGPMPVSTTSRPYGQSIPVIPTLLPLGQSITNVPQPAALDASVLVPKAQTTSAANGPNGSMGNVAWSSSRTN